MPFYRRHPLAMVVLRLVVSVAAGACVLADPPPEFDRTRSMMLAVFVGFVAAWIVGKLVVLAYEGGDSAERTRFLDV